MTADGLRRGRGPSDRVLGTTTRPTRRFVAIGFGALLLFGVGTNVQAGWVLVVAALLLGVLVAGVIIPIRSLRGLTLSRSVPRTAFAGQPVAVTVDVANTSRSVRALIRIDDDFLGRAHAAIDVIAGGTERSYEAQRNGARRGVYESGICTVASGFPFGVVSVSQTRRITSPTIIYPAVFNAAAWRLRGPAGWPAPSALGDVSSVRDYKSTDPLRHIHWRSTAKRGQLMVREFDREVQASTAVFADVPAGASAVDAGDAVASIASSIAIAALREGEVSVDGMRARTSDAILEWGARLQASDDFAPSSLDREGSADAVVYVGTASLVPVDRLTAIAASSSVSAVIVDDGGPGSSAEAVASRLRAADATVAIVEPGSVRAWFEGGCRAT